MAGSGRVVCLGTGTSHGVPMIGCDCAVCRSDDPRDRRTRCSVWVAFGGRSILVDTAPEFRLQCVACDVRRVDAVLYTHHHSDHVCGLDDLRRFNWLQQQSITCYASAETSRALERMFSYAFSPDPEYPSAAPQLSICEIDGRDPAVMVGGVPVGLIPLWHGQMPVLGFRFGGFAYCTDCNRIPEESMRRLAGLDVLILDALRVRSHPTHFNLEQAVEMAERIGAGRTFFTHIAHELGHAETNARLPEGMALAYDGQVIEFGG